MASSPKPLSGYPQTAWLVPDPLGLYFRVARDDHKELLNFIAAGDAECMGAVFDPTLVKRHRELRAQVLQQRIDAVLDPKTQQSALPGGYTESIGELPWGASRPHTHA